MEFITLPRVDTFLNLRGDAAADLMPQMALRELEDLMHEADDADMTLWNRAEPTTK